MTAPNSIFKILSASVIAFTLMFFTANAIAASCKGKTNSACSTSSDCYWVKGYKRKDGVKVSSHCRTKAGKSTAKTKKNKSTQKSKKTSSSKATKKASNQSAKKTKNIKTKVKKDKKKDKKSK